MRHSKFPRGGVGGGHILGILDDRDGDIFAELTPVHCEKVAIVKRVGADMHVIYYGRVAMTIGGEIQIVRRPVLYLVVPVDAIEWGRQLANAELQKPVGEGDMPPPLPIKVH